MDFDEYDYLEKTVEDQDDHNRDSTKKKDTTERSYRKREELDDDRDADERRSKRSRGDDENGSSKKDRDNRERHRDHERSSGRDKERDRERSSGRDKERDRERSSGRDKERDHERSSGRDKERDHERSSGRDKERDHERSSGRDKERDHELSSGRDKERDHERSSGRDKERERDSERSSGRNKERHRERDREGDKESERISREKDKDRDREREKERDKEIERDTREKDNDKEKEKEREKSRERRERSREKEKERERREREERERSRRSKSRSEFRDREWEPDFESRDGRRYRDKKEAVEPEADPERDQRTVFAYQMPLKATERDVYEFFSKAGKVRDVRLIMDRNSRRSRGVGYIEFYDAMSVPMAIALCGQLLLGQPVMVKPSEAEKNQVQSNATGGAAGVVGPYGAVDRKLYVGNLHFNMTESQLREIFESFGPVELVQLPLDLETGQCKGFGFIQFSHLEHAKAAAQHLNGKLEIAGRTIKVSSVTDHVGSQDTTAKSADFDDDEGGLALNAQSRAILMQKLDRSGLASSIGLPIVNGSAPAQQPISLPIGNPGIIPATVFPAQVMPIPVAEPVGNPSECLLLKNMFDPTTEIEPDFDLDIKEDVEEECSKHGRVKHIYVDKRSAGFVYLRFETVEAASAAQREMHNRWFARRLISAVYMQPQIYEAKFKGEA